MSKFKYIDDYTEQLKRFKTEISTMTNDELHTLKEILKTTRDETATKWDHFITAINEQEAYNKFKEKTHDRYEFDWSHHN